MHFYSGGSEHTFTVSRKFPFRAPVSRWLNSEAHSTHEENRRFYLALVIKQTEHKVPS